MYYFQYNNLFRFIDMCFARQPIFICLCYIAVLRTVHLTLDVWPYVGMEHMLILRKYLEMYCKDFAVQNIF